VFDDGNGGGLELGGEFERGIRVPEIVVTQRLALDLFGVCDTGARGPADI